MGQSESFIELFACRNVVLFLEVELDVEENLEKFFHVNLVATVSFHNSEVFNS